ncbi:nicolin-1 isoform X2 [Bufo bufo]|uniref:nicolin-1 isoform X2 n=1 Tax=Bufo bufo TaxID=8384 RepID=UPI001ABE6170|nr:nicolin-1 isoform X2 [Bufo bufo]
MAVPCNVRAPVPLQVGDGTPEPGRPGVNVIDVTFPSSQAVDMLCEADKVVSLRFVLRQPSPVWLSFTLEELQINPPGRQIPQNQLSWWLSHLPPREERRKLHKGLPDPERVSSEVQRMWALTEVMRSSQSTATVGRFDVDGCYDINLLSYT